MSLSLKIDNGDLSIGKGRSLDTVSGSEKLAQDLRLWVLERIGTDPATPQYGSRLDGGVVNGVPVDTFIGTIGTDERVSEIRGEVSTLLAQYQQLQIEKMRQETILYNGQHTLSPDEILHIIQTIEAKQVATTVIVRVSAITLSGADVRLTIPVES